MQLPTWLGHVLKSGEVKLFTDDVEALQIRVSENKIDFNAARKDVLKDVFGNARTGTSIGSALEQLKDIAGELKDEGLTFTLSFKGNLLVTMGSQAKPKISHFLTKTDALEINNLRKLLEMAF